MNIFRTPPPDPSPPARVAWSDGVVVLRDEALFGPDGGRPCERFLGRVLGVAGVRSVSIDRSKATATIRHDVGRGDSDEFLRGLSAALRDLESPESAPALPPGVREASCTIYRHGDVLTTCEVASDQPGRLRLRHETLTSDRALARRVARALATVPGVSATALSLMGRSLLLCYDPAVINTSRLLRLADEAFHGSGGWGLVLPGPTRTKFALANTKLGISALADFVVPALAPVSAVLLVWTNLRTLKAAALQVRRKRVGLPVLYTFIVGGALASGRFVACALMSLCFKFWHGRLRSDLATERRRLLDECLPRPRLARLITPVEGEVLVPLDRLRLGDRVAVGADESVPADGRIIAGEGIVDERSVRGLEGASRKRVGDVVLAGSTVLAGAMRLEVTAAADRTRASSIVRALVAATSPAAGPTSPTLRAERFAEKAVLPTLATAGVGLLVGDLTAAAAILGPDYVTGPALAGPLETLRNAAVCARRGIVVRRPDAFARLAEVDLIVLDDDPALRRVELEVSGLHTRLPETELLRIAASAFRHLADDRVAALESACRSRRAHLLDLPPVGFDPGVTVVHGKRRVCVREHDPAAVGSGPLLVEVDGAPVGVIRFARTTRPEAAAALRRLRDVAPVPVALVSGRPEAEVAPLASRLGVPIYKSDLEPGDTERFLRACREQGVKTAFVGRCHRRPDLAAVAHVAISLADDADVDSDPAAVSLLRARLGTLPDLWEAARAHEGEVRDAQKIVLVPNMLCVVGAFLFGFTSLTSVMISNLGTFGLYRRAVGPLRGLEPTGRGRTRHPSLPR